MQKISAKFVPRVLILVTVYLSKIGIKTVPQPPYSPDLAPCDFSLFPKLNEKLRGCRYETIEEMKEAVTKVIDTDFHGAFQKLLERYNKCIAAGGDYFEGDSSFMCVLSIKVPIRKKSGNLSYAPRIYKERRISWKEFPKCDFQFCIFCCLWSLYFFSFAFFFLHSLLRALILYKQDTARKEPPW